MGAALAALFLVGGAETEPRAQPDRWRLRALEAERRIAALRRLAELDADARPGSAGRDARAAAQPAQPPLAPSPALRELAPDERAEEWDALIAGAVDAAAERLGRTPTPEERAELIEALRDVRSAALALEASASSSDEGGEPDEAAWGDRLTRSLVLLEADRRVRAVLGVGVPELVSTLEADGEAPVEDLTAPPRAAER
jgi:hypothetical protein